MMFSGTGNPGSGGGIHARVYKTGARFHMSDEEAPYPYSFLCPYSIKTNNPRRMTDPRLLLDNLMSIDISSIRDMQMKHTFFFEGASIRRNVPNRSMKNIIDEYMEAHPKATMPKAPPST